MEAALKSLRLSNDGRSIFPADLCSSWRRATKGASAFSSSSSNASWIRAVQPPRKRASSLLIFIDKKSLRSAPASSSSSSSLSASAAAPEAEEETAEAEIWTGIDHHPKTASVKFVLRKECMFGQQFLLVGDDPVLGLWDPSRAIPLEWSDGHVWTAQLDVPVGKALHFKFILRGFAGEITWQPGPDRVLKIRETPRTGVVWQDWDNAENREIEEEEEEEPLAILTEEAIIVESEPVTDETHLRKSDATEIQGHSTHEKLSQGMGDEKKLNCCYEADRILVPGLAPLPASETASVFSKDAMTGMVADALLASDEAEDCNPSQLPVEERKPGVPGGNLLDEESSTPPETSSGDDSEETQSYGGDFVSEEKLHPEGSNSQSIAGVVKNDMRWGRRTLHQLLLNLGITMNPTESA